LFNHYFWLWIRTQALSPEDAKHYDYFLFGGILGDIPSIDRFLDASSGITG
jgi:ribosome biogenesis SPOUT family RNA methylase Rps3